jgi:hypothetical protein
MGKVPPTPSYVLFVPTSSYYAALIGLTPEVLMVQMLVIASFLHVTIQLSERPSDFDKTMNIVGMTALVVGTVLIPWDWIWFVVGGVGEYLLGISHLVISLWATLLTVLGLRRTLSVPLTLAVPVSLLAIPVGLPVAIRFIRSPF